MKKIITLCALSLSLGLSAQIAAYKLSPTNVTVTTATITNGYNLQLYTAVNGISTDKIKFVNNSASTQTYSAKRFFVSQSPALSVDPSGTITPNTYFCFGQTCFGDNVDTVDPPNYTILNAGEDSQTTYTTSSTIAQPCVLYLQEGAALGNYTVRYKIFNVNNPLDTLSFNAVYNAVTPVGIKTNEEKLDAISELYPNPNSNGSAISFDLNSDQDLKFQIYNSLGSLVYNINKQKYTAGKNKLNMEGSSLSNGVYLITITGDADKVTTKRLIINR